MNILLIAEKLHYRDWIGKTYRDIVQNYVQQSVNNVTLIYSDQEIKHCDSWDIIILMATDKITFGNQYNLVLNLNIPIYISCLDLFHTNECLLCSYINKAKGIIHFSHASKMLSPYSSLFNNNIHTLPARYINTNIFKNWEQEKYFDILIYGSRNVNVQIQTHVADQEYKQKWEQVNQKPIGKMHAFYPLREKLESLITKHTNKYRVKIIKQACIFNAPVANADLSKLINQSWLTISTTSRADIAMAKYFEIAGSYSGILGNIPTDYEHIYKNKIVEVNEWMSDEEILSVIDNALSDKIKLQEMINDIGDYTHEHYNLNACVRDMDELFENLKYKLS